MGKSKRKHHQTRGEDWDAVYEYLEEEAAREEEQLAEFYLSEDD